MRKVILALMLALAGCTVQPPVYDLPNIVPMVASTSQDHNPTWNTAGVGKIVTLYWKASIPNLLGKTSSHLIVDCLDENGKVLARDQFKCVMEAGKVLEMSNSMDIPSEITFKIKKVVISLIANGKG